MRKPKRSLYLALVLSLCISSALSAATLSISPLPPITDSESDGSIGSSYSFYGAYEGLAHEYAPLAWNAGSRFDRIDFAWDRIEASPGNPDYSAYDRVVSHNAANGLEMIGILQSTAFWATSGCPAAASGLDTSPAALDRLTAFGTIDSIEETQDLPWCPYPPENLYLAWNDPANYWGRFVYNIVAHYNQSDPAKPQVDVWEIWNEPDWSLFWRGSKADYAQLLKVAYQAARAANPDATVLFGGLFYWIDTNWYKGVMDILPTLEGAAANNNYFDVLSLHQYSNIYNISPTVSTIKSYMAATVGAHPVWITETGVPLCEEPGFGQQCAPGSYFARAEEAAYYAIEGYTESRAAGVGKFVWFRMHDETMSEAFGLMRNDFTYRPSYVGLQVAARYLHGENQITGPLASGTARRFSFWGTPRGLIDVLWNTSPTPITTTRPAYVSTATLVNHQGITQTLTPSNGVYTLNLGGATTNTGIDGAYIIGGPPLLLIQTDTISPSSALDVLPAQTYSDTVSLSWTVNDDHAGYWYAEVETARDPAGPWALSADWGETSAVTSTKLLMSGDGTWYFRMRARDRTGNWEAFPSGAESSTTLILTRTVSLNVSTYIDANLNGQRDAGESAPGTPVDLRWLYVDGTPIASTLAQTWVMTQTINFGDTRITSALPGYLGPWQQRFVAPGPDTQLISLDIGLREISSLIYLPSVRK